MIFFVMFSLLFTLAFINDVGGTVPNFKIRDHLKFDCKAVLF